MATRDYSVKKQKFFEKMNRYFDEYEKILVVGCDNVKAKQFNNMRIGMRATGDLPFCGNILMGKNTLMKKCLKERYEADPENALKKLQHEKFDELLKLNVGLIFTNDDLNAVAKYLKEDVVQAPAKVGAVAPCDVFVKKGLTTLEPGQTSFFQALNIHTKIFKSNIEILNDVHLIKKGDKVGPSQAILLQKLGEKPFFYGLELQMICDQGSFYTPAVLEMTDDVKAQMVGAAIANVTKLSLGTGYTTEASLPHLAINTFKKVFSVSLGTEYDFEAFNCKQLKQDIKEGKIQAAAAPAAAAAAAPAAEAKAAEPEPAADDDDDDEGMEFGLFD